MRLVTGEFHHHNTQELFSSTMDFIVYSLLIFSIFFPPSVQASKLKLEFCSRFFRIQMSFLIRNE